MSARTSTEAQNTMRTPLLLAALALVLTACSDGATPVATAPTPVTGPTAVPVVPPTTEPSTQPRPEPASQPGSQPESEPSSEPSTVPTPATSPSPVPSGPEDPLAPRPALESPAPLGAPTCQAGDLSVVDADAIVTPSTVREIFVVRTSGPQCQLLGYPEVELRGAGGAALPVRVGRGGYGLPAEQPAAVSLSRDTSVSFQVATDRSGDCTQAETVVVRLPGSAGPLTTETYLLVCGGAVGLSPVERGGSDH